MVDDEKVNFIFIKTIKVKLMSQKPNYLHFNFEKGNFLCGFTNTDSCEIKAKIKNA